MLQLYPRLVGKIEIELYGTKIFLSILPEDNLKNRRVDNFLE